MARSKPAKVVKYRPYPKYPFPRVRGLRARLSPARALEQAAWSRKGGWTNVIFLIFVARTAKGFLKRKPEALALDKLRPGQSISIITAPRTGKRR